MPASHLQDSDLTGLGYVMGITFLKSHQVILMDSQFWSTGVGAVKRDSA